MYFKTNWLSHFRSAWHHTLKGKTVYLPKKENSTYLAFCIERNIFWWLYAVLTTANKSIHPPNHQRAYLQSVITYTRRRWLHIKKFQIFKDLDNFYSHTIVWAQSWESDQHRMDISALPKTHQLSFSAKLFINQFFTNILCCYSWAAKILCLILSCKHFATNIAAYICG